jgi:signal transduction histidine kinase
MPMETQIQTTIILLIEDDEEDYILLKKHLSRIVGERYEVLWETTYEQGLTRMLEGKHDLCMLDYRLGIHNGIELIASARQQGYSLPIVLLTGASGQHIDILALQAGADDYIDKGHLQGELLQRVIRYAIERKKAEHEREKLLREQIATRELEQRRNEFTSMVVHEIKTPLTSIKGYVQLLHRKSERAGDEQTRLLTARMDTQINKLTGLIDDLLDVTRIAGGKLQMREELFAFDELVQEVIGDLQPLTEHQLILREGKTEARVWGDRLRIGQVITNFLTNAIKYAPSTDRILVKSCSDGQSVTLCVQDFGPGISKDQQAKVFDPFYRVISPTQREIPGLGLGLHISAEIIQRHEGHIWVESEAGNGATFCFSLSLDRKMALEPDLPEQMIQEATR